MTRPSLVRWLHVGDLHASAEDGWQSVDLFSRIVDEIATHVPDGALDFAFLPGDNANHGEPEQYRRIAEHLRRLPLPCYAIPGDHDFEPGSLAAFAAIATTPLPAMVRVDGRRALFLDIVSHGGGGPDFRLGAAQTDWLRAQLSAATAAGEPRPIVFMHAFADDLHEGARRIGRLFADAQVAFVDTGHTHYNELINDGAVIYSATRSTGQVEEGPPGFAIAAVDGDVASWRFKAIDTPWPWVLITSPADARLAIGTGAPAAAAATVRALVLGRDLGDVRVTVDDAASQPMQPVPEHAGLWSAALDRPLGDARRVAVTATGPHGVVATDTIRLQTPDPSDGPDDAWVARGVLGTKLGPNANGRKW